MLIKKAKKEILLINKPIGITSFDVIRQLRKQLGIKKMGHAGTLDPLASGLMIIGIDKGTKKLEKYLKLPKVYVAEILLGKSTTTGDMEGEIREEIEITDQNLPSTKQINQALQALTGKITLSVPRYSAIKQSGVPLYKKARHGEKFIPPKKEMYVFWIKFLDEWKGSSCYILKIQLKVASGTYIRSVVKEIGRLLNLPATLKRLTRTKIGDYELKNAKSIEEIAL